MREFPVVTLEYATPALTGVTAQEFIQRFFAAVERVPIVVLVHRLFMPCRSGLQLLESTVLVAQSI
jgi:hypothetical protein